MCSLSYIPQQGGFSLSHNRDELPFRRSSSSLVREAGQQGKYYFPQDLKAGGTWMAAREDGLVACLLNGGSKDYIRQLPYRMSRGKVILSLMEASSIQSFRKSFSATDIEPFTLIVRGSHELWQWVHDPKADDWQELDPASPHFWSSTKLYASKIREARLHRFSKWINAQSEPKAKDIQDFHLSEQINETEGGLVLPKQFPLRTVSFCQFNQERSQSQFLYKYLHNQSEDLHSWKS